MIILGCTDDGGPLATKGAVGPRSAATSLQAIDPAHTRDRATAALERTRWVGELHNKVMDDLVRNRAYWLRAGSATAEVKCAALVRLIYKYIPEIDARVGHARSDRAMRDEALAAVRATDRCPSVGPMSVTGLPPRASGPTVTAALLQTTVSEEELVTGDYQSYLDAMPGAAESTDGTPDPVATATSAIVNSAASISAADLALVASGANLSVSSSQEWTPIYSSGGGGGATIEEPYFMFRRRVGPLAIIVGSDVLGCVAGAADGWISGERRWGYLAAKCVIWGAAASGAAHLAI